MKELINLMTRTSTIRFILVLGMLSLTAAFVLGLFFFPYPQENREPINMALVGVLNWTSMIVATYYNKPTPNNSEMTYGTYEPTPTSPELAEPYRPDEPATKAV